MQLSKLMERINKMPWKAKSSIVEDRDGLLVADANVSCGISRGTDLANAEYIALAANMLPKIITVLEAVHAKIHSDCTEQGCSDLCCQIQTTIAKAKRE